MRPCNGPGKGQRCPTGAIIPKGQSYCAECARGRDHARGSRQERGYGAAHERTRAALLPEAYGTRCLHCGEYMWPHQNLALDHTEDRAGYRGIVHAACNASEGASRGNRYRN